jgi:hypothetical protein
MRTLAQVIDTYGVDVDEHLDRQVTVAVSSGVQRQGDVIVVPANRAASTAVPKQGVPVVRGENGGNTHLLLADGLGVFYDAASDGGLNLGLLTVTSGSTAYLAHPEHGYMGIAPGAYVIRRQREQADEIRLVAD